MPTATPPIPCKLQCQLFKHIFPYCLDGGPAHRDILVTGNFLEAAVDLPSDYQRALEQFVFLWLVLVFRSQQTYDGLNFPQYKNFDSFYSMEDPDVNVFFCFETVAGAAYSGDTQLLPDEDNEFHLFEPNPNNAHRPPVASVFSTWDCPISLSFLFHWPWLERQALGVQIPPKQGTWLTLWSKPYVTTHIIPPRDMLTSYICTTTELYMVLDLVY